MEIRRDRAELDQSFRKVLAGSQRQFAPLAALAGPGSGIWLRSPDYLYNSQQYRPVDRRVRRSREALRLFEALLPDQDRVLGPDHPETLKTRNNIGYSTGQSGDLHNALGLTEALLPDQERVLGPDDTITLTTRNNIAHWTGECGDPRGALRLFEALLPDQERVLGPDHPDTLRTRNNIAHWTGLCGDVREALRLVEALLPDQERVLGPDHPSRSQSAIISPAGPANAGTLKRRCVCSSTASHQERVLGPDHPDTLRTRSEYCVLDWQLRKCI